MALLYCPSSPTRFALRMLMECWEARGEHLKRDCAPATASAQRAGRSPSNHLWLRVFTSHTLDQRSLATLGTCRRVGTEDWRMVDRDGNSGLRVEGEEGVDGWLGWAEEAEDNWFEQPCGRVLWQFPASLGKQCEQGVTVFTHAHLRHLAVLLHLQHRRRQNGARDKDEGATWHAHGYCSFYIIMNNQVFMNKLDYS